MTDVDFGSNEITDLGTPVNSTDAATKGYVDTAIAGVSGGAQVFGSNFISGLFPEQQTLSKIRFYNGAIANGQTTPTSIIQMNANFLDCDMTTNGINGLDTGSLANNTSYYFYLLRNTANTATGVLASTSQTYSGLTYPSGYSISSVAQIPFAAVYRTTVGFTDFRVHGWPSMSPEIHYYDWDVGSSVLSSGTATTLTAVNLYTGSNAWVPSSARRALIEYVLTSTGSAVDLNFHLDTGSTNTQYIDSVPATSGFKVSGERWVTLTSSGNFDYKLSGTGANVTLRCVGYAMSTT